MKIHSILFAVVAFAVLLLSGCGSAPAKYVAETPAYCNKVQEFVVELVAKRDPQAQISAEGAELITTCVAKKQDFCGTVVDAWERSVEKSVTKGQQGQLNQDAINLVRTCIAHRERQEKQTAMETPAFCNDVQKSTVEFVSKRDPQAQISMEGAELITTCIAKKQDFCDTVMDASIGSSVVKGQQSQLSPAAENLVKTCIAKREQQEKEAGEVAWRENLEAEKFWNKEFPVWVVGAYLCLLAL